MLEGNDISKEGAKTPTPDRGMLLIISGPSGVGKTTISRAVEKAFGGVLSVSLRLEKKESESKMASITILWIR